MTFYEIVTPEVKDAEALVNYVKIIGTESEFICVDDNGGDLTVDQESKFIQDLHHNNNGIILCAKVIQLPGCFTFSKII